MRKIPTVFQRDPDDRKYVLPTVNPACQWVLDGEGRATRKYDGTCIMLDEAGDWWARREVKPGKTPPPNYVPVTTDDTTGKTMGWEPIGQSAFAKFHAEAIDNHRGTNNGFYEPRPGTYELIGPKVNGNPEKEQRHWLVEHAKAQVLYVPERDFASLRQVVLDLAKVDRCEGLVFHHEDGIRFAKVKARDFRKDGA